MSGPKVLDERLIHTGLTAHPYWMRNLHESPFSRLWPLWGGFRLLHFLARRCAMRPFSIKMHNRTGGLVLSSGGEAGWLFFLKNSMADISLTYNKCQRMIWRKRLEGDKYPLGHMCPPLHCIWHIPAYYPCAK